jgi:hypothetical protein
VGTYDLNFSVSDNFAIWGIVTDVKKDMDVVLYENITNISLNTSVSNYNYSNHLHLFDTALYTFNYTIYDAHTDLDISDKIADMKTEIITSKNSTITELKTTLDNTEFSIIYPKTLVMEMITTKEAINYKYTNTNVKQNTSYSIESKEPIKYLANSIYPCHFIINNLWHDCSGLNNVIVVKQSDYKYNIYFDLPQNKSVIEESTGILNTISYSGWYNVTEHVDVNISNGTSSVNVTIIIDNIIDIENDINITQDYGINITITTPDSSTDTSISNIYYTFAFLFVLYVLMFWVSISLNTKIGLILTFLSGVILGLYFTSVISGIYATTGYIFIILNAFFIIFCAMTDKGK